MPRGDRSGPMGAGPMTGRGLGYCAGYAEPGYAADAYGGGRGPGGYGRQGGYGGRGRRHRYYATGVPGWRRAASVPAYPPPVGYGAPGAPATRDEIAALRAEADHLAAALDETRARLAALESNGE